MEKRVRIGIISDTHGLVRPEALEALQGVDMILHAGDVGGLEVLAPFQKIAQVHAVRGNTDYGPWAESLPVTELVEFADTKFFLIHVLEEMNLVPEAAGISLVVSGHTHRVKEEVQRGVLYLNPGRDRKSVV